MFYASLRDREASSVLPHWFSLSTTGTVNAKNKCLVGIAVGRGGESWGGKAHVVERAGRSPPVPQM